jgi:hypothetical protein
MLASVWRKGGCAVSHRAKVAISHAVPLQSSLHDGWRS